MNNNESKLNGSTAPRSSPLRPAPETLGVTAIKPKVRDGWDAVRHLVYDRETGAFFSRTPKSWALITLFYIAFYAGLAAFWFGLLEVKQWGMEYQTRSEFEW